MANRFLNNIRINDEYTLPAADGSADQIITTDGAGQLSFVDQSTLASGSAERTEILVKNVHGSSLSKGDPVYIVGSVGASDRLEVALADAGNAAKMPCVGLLTQDLANNGQGTATVTGKLRNLITSPIDGATPTENDTIYVKSGGGLTLTKPTGSTNLIQNVGQVGRVSTSSDGNVVVSAILRSNDVPNLPTGKIWVGDGNTTTSTVVHLDEPNGRMGIGTTSPGYKLQVGDNGVGDGNITMKANGTGVDAGAKLTFNMSVGGGNADSYIAQIVPISYDSLSSGVHNSLNFKVGTWNNNADAGVSRMTILSNGNIGIGTTDPGTARLAVIGGNVGIGTTSPLTNLHIANTGGAAQLSLERTDTSDTLKLVIASSYGYLQNTTGPLSLGTTGGSQQVYIATDGNVGIGTTSPSARLDISGGDIRLSTNATYLRSKDSASAIPRVLGMNASNAFYIGPIDSYAGGGIIYGASSNVSYHGFYGGGSEKVRITSSGDVGIGETSIDAKLHLTAASSGLINQKFESAGSAAWRLGIPASQTYFAFDNANDNLSAPKVVIDSSGNVGIGTTSPAHKLTVNAANNTTAVGIDFPSASFDFAAASTSGYTTLFNMDNTGLDIGHNSTGRALNLKTGSLDRVTILGNGNVGIGTTNPGGKLSIGGASGELLKLDDSSATGNPFISIWQAGVRRSYIQYVDSGDNLTFASEYGGMVFMTGTGGTETEKIRITSTGNVGIGTTSPDYKLDVAGTIGMDTYLYHNGDTDTFIGYPAANTFDVNAGGVKQLSVTSDNVNITDTLSYTYPTATNEYNGEIVTFGSFNTANGTIAAGDVIVYTTAGVNSGWMRAQGNTTYSKGMLGIAMGTSASDGILIKGFARNAAFASGGLGSPLYLSPTSAGDTTNVIPSSTNNVVRIVGYMLNPTNDEIFFDPDKSWVQVS